MAISPVSSVSFRNNYNQVNFEGKKKEKVGYTQDAASTVDRAAWDYLSDH